jgi:phosphatidylglycerophosphate synthase
MSDLIPSFVPATRIQQSLVAAVEKRALLWMADLTPPWINSDHLTIMGFVAQCMAGACYALAPRYPAALVWGVVCLGLNWVGDSLDGTLARVRNCQRPRYGFYVDHVADSVAALFLMGGLALSVLVHPAIAIGLLLAFLMLSIESYLATYTLGTFHMSHWVFGPTELRLLLAAGNVAVFHDPAVTVFGTHWRLFDFGGALGIAGMSSMFLVATIRHVRQLYREEKIVVTAGSSASAMKKRNGEHQPACGSAPARMRSSVRCAKGT